MKNKARKHQLHQQKWYKIGNAVDRSHLDPREENNLVICSPIIPKESACTDRRVIACREIGKQWS